MDNFPPPIYPKLRRPTADDVRRKLEALFSARPDFGLRYWPDYQIVKGDKILLVALSEHHPLVIETFCQVLREKGARVDLLTIDSKPVAPPQELASHEAIAIGKEEGDFSYYYTLMCDFVRPDTARAVIERDKYTKIIGGAAGPVPHVPIPWHRFGFFSIEDFADGGVIDFPPEVFAAIAERTWGQIQSCDTLMLRDPEGTDIKWTNYNDERVIMPGHLMARPRNIGHGFGGKDDCAGIVSGTTNHLGAFPHIRAYIEAGQVVKVEGGGRYGDAWREKLEMYRRTKLPPIKYTYGRQAQFEIADAGLFWFFECAIGGEPKVFRLPQEGIFEWYANCLHERRRSGFIHNGFGPPMGQTQPGLPWVHVHIHCMFPTLEGVTSKGETVRIIDKGHLCALDDSMVREIAARYGDPDELLREVWFPAMPGINAPGDYMKDYARDPVSWIMREAREHPVWVD